MRRGVTEQPQQSIMKRFFRFFETVRFRIAALLSFFAIITLSTVWFFTAESADHCTSERYLAPVQSGNFSIRHAVDGNSALSMHSDSSSIVVLIRTEGRPSVTLDRDEICSSYEPMGKCTQHIYPGPARLLWGSDKATGVSIVLNPEESLRYVSGGCLRMNNRYLPRY